MLFNQYSDLMNLPRDKKGNWVLNSGKTLKIEGTSNCPLAILWPGNVVALPGSKLIMKNVIAKPMVPTRAASINLFGGKGNAVFDDISAIGSVTYGMGGNHILENIAVFNFGDNSEDINAITCVGLGPNNTFNNIEISGSRDDGIELFECALNIKGNLKIDGALDDYFDADFGDQSTIDNLICSVTSDTPQNGNSMVELGGSPSRAVLGKKTTTKIKSFQMRGTFIPDGEPIVNYKTGSVPKPLAINVVPGTQFKVVGSSSLKSNLALPGLLIGQQGSLVTLENVSVTAETFASDEAGVLLLGRGNEFEFNDFVDAGYGPFPYGINKEGGPHKLNNVDLTGLGSNNKDLNALTLVGLHTDSTINKVDVKNSKDDGIEIFNGNVDVTNCTVDNAFDDAFDVDSGYIGNVKGLKIVSTTNTKSLIEVGGDTESRETIPNFIGQVNISGTVSTTEEKVNVKDNAAIKFNGKLLTPNNYDNILEIN